MTGFATADTAVGSTAVEVVLRSLNHRHLDIRVHLPELLRDSEPRWAAMIRARVQRGRVEAAVKLADEQQSPDPSFDHELIRRIAAEVAALGEQGLVTGGITGGDLLGWEPALRMEQNVLDLDALVEGIEPCFQLALERLIEARRHEGERLAAFLLERVDQVETLGAELVSRRAQVEEGLRDEYQRRLMQLGAGEALSEERLALEVASAIEKATITEETDRLGAHCEHFRDVMSSDRAGGRKLDFIIQEIFREFTTIAAKARDSESVHLAIEGKTVCEDLREQLRNVE